MSRLCAFRSSLVPQYYVFNDDKTALIPIKFNPSDPIYAAWMDPNELNNLTEEQCVKVAGYYLELYSDIEDDVYNVTMENYDILQTTDKSHFILSGFGGILGMKFADTSTTCHIILSFDNRQTWVYYDSVTGEWKKTFLSRIHTSQSNTIQQVNNFGEAIFAKIFKKHCNLDYAIAIENSEHVGSVTLSLPDNYGPTIIALDITGDEDGDDQISTHEKKVNVFAHIDDPEGDDVFYEIRRKFKGKEMEGFNGVPPIESGKCNPYANGKYYYTIDPKNFEIGMNEIIFVFTDEKGDSNQASIFINKINTDAVISLSVFRDKLTYSIVDEDSDKGKYRIRINDVDILTPGYVPAEKPGIDSNGDAAGTQEEPIKLEDDMVTGWSEIMDVPIEVTDNNPMQIPWDKIKFGVINTITIEFQEEFYNAVKLKSSVDFIGTYFGILFVDPAEPFYINNDPTKPNINHYYSTSLGEVLKKIQLGGVTHTQNSKTVEVGVINLSGEKISQAVINGFTNKDENYRVSVSTSETFNPLSDNLTIHFDNIDNYDPTAEKPDMRRFYVKLFSLDTVNADVDDMITVKTNEESTSNNS